MDKTERIHGATVSRPEYERPGVKVIALTTCSIICGSQGGSLGEMENDCCNCGSIEED